MMLRITLPRSLCVCALVGLVGCGHMMESKAINQFTQALAEKDLEQLKSATSSQFEERALRSTEALDDFKILNLPKGETTVVEVDETSETEKLVTVTAGTMKKKLFYRLVKDEDSEEWVVDDVYVRQRKDSVKVDKSVAEQMDLLLSVREFLTVWDQGTREEVLSVATPELAAVLGELPPMHLSRLCKQVVSEHVDDKSHRPRAQLDNDVAVVTLPRKTGKMILSYKLADGQWRVSDVAVESKQDQEHIPSVMKTATVIRSAVQFLDAYNTGNKDRLKTVTHPKFYEGSLLPGDLTTIRLPDQFISNGRYHVKMEGAQADFVIDEPGQVVKIGLAREVNDDPLEKKTVYLIDDVTIYPTPAEGAPLQEMRLSMVFTGRAVLDLFRESLAQGNLPLLKKTATQDFNSRVWSRIEEEAVVEFTPRLMTNHIEETIHAEYDGAICRITVRQMGQSVTYVLRDRNGLVAVDDVLIEQSEELASMKETLELMIPVRNFREALAKSDMDTLKRTSSAELNRMIWKLADNVPAAGQHAVKHMLAPLNKVEQLPEGRSLITLGNASFGCSVLLVTEHDQKVVDDIVLVAGVQPELRARFRTKVREQLALGGPASETRPTILHAGNWQESTSANRPGATVQQADFEQFPPLPASNHSAVTVPPPEFEKVDASAVGFDENVSSQPPELSPSAPPLFPGGEADLERVPEIRPSESAFDSPIETP